MLHNGGMPSPTRIPRPATSADVARHAGVSRATVSAILNGNGRRFPQATHDKVFQSAQHLDYKPSLAARSLASGRSDTVVLLLPNTTFASNQMQDSIDGIVEALGPLGGNVVLRFAGSDTNRTLQAIERMRPQAVVHLNVLSVQAYTELQNQGIKVIPTLTTRTNFPDSDGGIAQLQYQALSKYTDRRFWYASLGETRTDIYGPARYEQMSKISKAMGLDAPKQITIPASKQPAFDELDEILGGGEPVGVLCYNDDVALRLLAAAQQRAIEVPAQMAIVGVDHGLAGQLWSPRLTTIDTNMREFMQKLTNDLKALLIDGEDSTPTYCQIPMSLVLGATT